MIVVGRDRSGGTDPVATQSWIDVDDDVDDREQKSHVSDRC